MMDSDVYIGEGRHSNVSHSCVKEKRVALQSHFVLILRNKTRSVVPLFVFVLILGRQG